MDKIGSNELTKKEALQLKLREKLKNMHRNRTKNDTKKMKENKVKHLNKIEFDVINVSKDLIKKVNRDRKKDPNVNNVTLARRYIEKMPYTQLNKTFPKIFEFIIRGNIKSTEDLNALSNMLLQRQKIMNGELDFDDAQHSMGQHLFDTYGKKTEDCEKKE